MEAHTYLSLKEKLQWKRKRQKEKNGGKRKRKEKKMLQPSTGKGSETLRNNRCLQRVTRIGSGRASKRAQVQRAKQIAAHTEGERGTRDCVLQDRDERHLSCYYCVSSSRRALIPIRRRMQQQIFCGPGKNFPPSYLQLFFKTFCSSEILLQQSQLQGGDGRSFVLQGEFCNLQGGKKSNTKEEKPQVTE